MAFGINLGSKIMRPTKISDEANFWQTPDNFDGSTLRWCLDLAISYTNEGNSPDAAKLQVYIINENTLNLVAASNLNRTDIAVGTGLALEKIVRLDYGVFNDPDFDTSDTFEFTFQFLNSSDAVIHTATFTGQSLTRQHIDEVDLDSVITLPTYNGYSDGDIDITLLDIRTFHQSGFFGYQYEWSNATTNQDLTDVPAGSYTLTVRLDTFEVASETFIINEPGVFLPLDAEITPPLCNGSNIGSEIILTFPNGDNPNDFTYLWSNAATTKDISGIFAGDYTVEVFLGAVKVSEDTFTVGQPTAISVTATTTQKDIILDVSGGTPGYVYQWADGPQTKDRFDLNPGTYTVTVTDANGCQTTVEIELAEFRFFFSRNPVLLALSADSPETKPNLSFLCEVWVSINDEAPTKVIELEQPADSLGGTVFNVKTILKDYVGAVLPPYNIATISRRLGAFTRFFLKYAEKFGEPPVSASLTQNDELYVLNGGLSDIEWAANTFFDTYFPTRLPFFTWAPNPKPVFDDQPEHLHFMCNNYALAEFIVKVHIYNADGTETIQQVFSYADPVKFEIYLIPAGITQLALYTLNGGKAIKSYKLWVEDADTNVLSEERTYVWKNKEGKKVRYFLFESALGGWDTLATLGYSESQMKSSAEVIEKELDDNYGVNDARFEVLEKIGQEESRVSAGYFTNSQFPWLTDFSLSKTVYEVRNGRYVPVQIKADPTFFDNFEPVRDFVFDVMPSVTHTFSPDL